MATPYHTYKMIADNFLIYMSPEAPPTNAEGQSVESEQDRAARMKMLALKEHFLESVDRDAMLDGYSFMHPFEEYRIAKEGLKKEMDTIMMP